MNFMEIFLCALIVRYSFAGYVYPNHDQFTFDAEGCLTRNKTVSDALKATAAKEDSLLESLEKYNSATENVLNQYKAAITLERMTVKQFIHRQQESRNETNRSCWEWKDLLGHYQYLIGSAAMLSYKGLHDLRHLRERHRTFFTTPSATLDKYLQMKRRENDTYSNFYHRGGQDLYERPTGHEFEQRVQSTFECPKTDGETEAQVVSQMNVQQVSAIFLCITIGVTIVDLYNGQRW